MPLSVIVVTYGGGEPVLAVLEAVRAQLEPGDEAIVVDNASPDGTADVIAERAPWVRLVRAARNQGFATACNDGARLASGDLLLFLNPDARPEPGALGAIRAGAERWDVFQGLVLEDDGATLNSAGGRLQLFGFAWAGGAGEPVACAPAAPAEIDFASGACLAATRAHFFAHDGFPDEFFMYCEDVDLSLRVRLAGGRVGIEPAARFRHDYAFLKGPEKWLRLQRNRWWTVLRTYPAPLLAAVLPGMLLVELALLAVAAREGWLRADLEAMREIATSLPRVRRERAAIQARRQIGSADFARRLSAGIDSNYVGAFARSAPARALLGLYAALVRAAAALDR